MINPPDSLDLDHIILGLSNWMYNQHIPTNNGSYRVSPEDAKSQILANYRSISDIKETLKLDIPEWDDEDGFCIKCGAFLEDDNFKCYCDIRNKLRSQILSALNIGDNNNG